MKQTSPQVLVNLTYLWETTINLFA